MSTTSSGVSGVAGRYAAALYELAEQQEKLDDIAGDLAGIRTMLAGSADLRRLVASPAISREDQSRALGAVLERAGVSDLTQRFVGVVGTNRRLNFLDDICAAYREILAARRGEVTAEVTTANPLSGAQRMSLQEILQGKVGTRVTISSRIDESLLGGMVVKIGSRMVDSSLRAQLQRLELSLKGSA